MVEVMVEAEAMHCNIYIYIYIYMLPPHRVGGLAAPNPPHEARAGCNPPISLKGGISAAIESAKFALPFAVLRN